MLYFHAIQSLIYRIISIFYMYKLVRQILQIAKKNPNELIGQRFFLTRELRNNKQQINNSLLSLVSLYKTAACHPKWAK
jgi:hypothetical protein